MKKEITIGELHEIYQKYGNLNFKVDTPYGFKNIEWCGITEENADVYRCELENGMYVEGADYHKVKHENGNFIHLKEAKVGLPVQTISGVSKIESVELMDFKDTLYDIQVAEVHQYYTNGIVSHNTTLVIDSIKYLLFGKTTKTDKNEEIFNQYSEGNNLVVKGVLTIDGEDDIVIERTMRRAKKRGEGWNISNNLNLYKLLPDGEEELLTDEDAVKTTEKIKEVVGTEKDFELIVLATARNLDDLIDFTSSESGKLLTKFIGLEVIELKEGIVRKMYNDFSKTMKSNHYDISTLNEDIEIHTANITSLTKSNVDATIKLDEVKNDLDNLKSDRDKLIGSKSTIDVTVLSLNPSKLNNEIEILTQKGLKVKEDIVNLTKEITSIGQVSFDDYNYDLLGKSMNEIENKIYIKKDEINKHKTTIDDLIAGGICKSCNRKLDDVDNTEHIKTHEGLINTLEKEIITLSDELVVVKDKYNSMTDTKKLVDKLNKLEINKDRLEVEIASYRVELKNKQLDLKKYEDNLDAIETNKKIDIEISMVDTKIVVAEKTKNDINNSIQRNNFDIEKNQQEIETKTKLIDQIEKEREVEIIFKLYIEMIGKKGISKLVLRSVLPIINSELQRLLDEVADFDVEITIDSKNEVRYLLVKDEVEKQLKSGSGFERTLASLALRCVLGKMCKLSMPNFITLDEVLGRVAPNNIEKMKTLFDKIKDMYDNIYFITQNDVVKDWADNIITVVKENNISKLKIS